MPVRVSPNIELKEFELVRKSFIQKRQHMQRLWDGKEQSKLM
jgi:hypothetical protein